MTDKRRSGGAFVVAGLLVTTLTLIGLCGFAYVVVRDQVRGQLRQTLATHTSVFQTEFVGTVERAVRGLELVLATMDGSMDDGFCRRRLMELARSIGEIVAIHLQGYGRRISAFWPEPNLDEPFRDEAVALVPQGFWQGVTSYTYWFGPPTLSQIGVEVLLPVHILVRAGGQTQAFARMDLNVTRLLEHASVTDAGFVSIGRYPVDLSVLLLDGTLVESSKNRLRRAVITPAPANEVAAAFAGRELYDLRDYFSRLVFRADVSSDAVSDVAVAAATGVFAFGLVTLVVVGALGGLLGRQLLRTDALRRRAIISRYEALQARMNPHFMFNSLNQIVGFAEEGDRASLLRSLRSLTYVLRQAVRTTGDMVPLQDELRLLQHYVELQRVHHGDRVIFVQKIDPALSDAQVIRLCLQPIIENSFVHGLAGSARPVTIRLEARREGDTIVVEVSDDGCGVSPERAAELNRSIRSETELATDHIGLASVHRRITVMHGRRYGIEVSPVERGFLVRMRLPFVSAAET